MENEKVLVTVFDNNLQAKQAIKKLQKNGYDMKKLSEHSGEVYGGFYLVPHSSLFLGLDRCLLPDLL